MERQKREGLLTAPMRKRDGDKQLVHNSSQPLARFFFHLFTRDVSSSSLLLLLLLVRDVRTHRMQFNISAAARFVHVDAPLCIPPTRPHSFTLMHHNLRCICRGAQRNAARRICGPSFITVSPSSRCTNIFEAIKKKNIHDEYWYFLSFFNVTYFPNFHTLFKFIIIINDDNCFVQNIF